MVAFMTFIFVLLFTNLSYGINKGSVRALNLLHDDLSAKVIKDDSFLSSISPLLLAEPQHFWKKSRSDFSSYAVSKLMKIFNQQIVLCKECNSWRLESKINHSIINNGPIGLSELTSLKKTYGNIEVKAYASLKETREGVEMKVIDIMDGTIRYYAFINARDINLNNQVPWSHFAQEKNRRINGDSLHYSFINLGIWKAPIFEIEFVEQWGSRNQHITGISLQLYTPKLGPSLGLTYHHLMPSIKRLQVSGTFFYALQSALIDVDTDGNSYSIRGMAQLRISNTYAIFVSLDTLANFSLGVTLYNPILLPFLL